MASEIFDVSEINRIVLEETIRCVAALKAEQSRLGIRSVSGALGNITYKLGRRDAAGIYTRIQFSFPRYGVFVHKGASRGHGGSKGSRWYSARNIVIHTNPASFGKMNTGSRKAKEWFNPVIENYVDIITGRLTDYFVNVSYKRLKIK